MNAISGALAQDEVASREASLQEDSGEALANGALWIYSMAFDEFRRALATESKDRAETLAAMWDHCFTLVQVRQHDLLQSARCTINASVSRRLQPQNAEPGVTARHTRRHVQRFRMKGYSAMLVTSWLHTGRRPALQPRLQRSGRKLSKRRKGICMGRCA